MHCCLAAVHPAHETLDSWYHPSLLGQKKPRVSRLETSNHSRPSNMQISHCTVPKGYSHSVPDTVHCHIVTARAMCNHLFYSLTGLKYGFWSTVCGIWVCTRTHPHTSCHLWEIDSLCVQGWYSRAHLSLLCTRAGSILGFSHSYANTDLNVLAVL